ncbi:uncharacterized protein MKK02DRAFT_30574 [Dioszegia hungarica]|uniref:Transcription factor domain-containing protein n=1 Tax=Dioszegia hungarica TaxID=4972 RepID=A0AA38H2H1_9TREE|nr:uncharacterized protein MKK02DRAFT_30574 [Dioszegia hungarica]KAI9632845.1 hypothetical protein MKK02DRAFT_30574 [Dioszegia hungarica]
MSSSAVGRVERKRLRPGGCVACSAAAEGSEPGLYPCLQCMIITGRQCERRPHARERAAVASGQTSAGSLPFPDSAGLSSTSDSATSSTSVLRPNTTASSSLRETGVHQEYHRGPPLPNHVPRMLRRVYGSALDGLLLPSSEIITRFLYYAPMFKEVINVQDMIAIFNGETTDESAYPTLALVHAICAVAYLADPSTSDAAPAEAQKAQMANDHLFETGRSRLGTYFILTVIIRCFYNLYQGTLMQNHRLSVEAVGWCNSAGLHLDPDLLPDGNVVGEHPLIITANLFWLTNILNIQVLVCSVPFSLGLLRNCEITVPVPSALDIHGQRLGEKQYVDSPDLFSYHEHTTWLGLYAKTAILLRDTQYFVNRIITVRNPMPIDDVISELDRIGEKLCALQDSYMQVDCSPAQVLIVRAMIAACHILPRAPCMRGTHHRGIHHMRADHFGRIIHTVGEDALHITQTMSRARIPDIEPFLVYTWMMVNRICLHPDTSPEFEGQLDATRSVAIADATFKAIEAVEAVGVPAAQGCMRILRSSNGILPPDAPLCPSSANKGRDTEQRNVALAESPLVLTLWPLMDKPAAIHLPEYLPLGPISSNANKLISNHAATAAPCMLLYAQRSSRFAADTSTCIPSVRMHLTRTTPTYIVQDLTAVNGRSPLNAVDQPFNGRFPVKTPLTPKGRANGRDGLSLIPCLLSPGHWRCVLGPVLTSMCDIVRLRLTRNLTAIARLVPDRLLDGFEPAGDLGLTGESSDRESTDPELDLASVQ